MINMKKTILTLCTCMISCGLILAQERYIDKIFDEVQMTDGVLYGTNITILPVLSGGDPGPQDLLLDIYEPVGDTVSERPVVIFAHRGDFLPPIVNLSPYGTRKDSAVVEFCTELAKRGFVAVSMDYRLGWAPPPFGMDIEIKSTVLQAVYRITQDMRTAVRFFRKTAAEDDNPYKIDPNSIAVAGMDAAGFAANNVAYLKSTDQAALPKFLDFSTMPPTPFIIEELHGDPYGITQTPLNLPNHVDYSSDVSVVIDFEGGLGDISWIEAGDPPTITFQAANKFGNPGIRDVTIGVGGEIIIAEGAFPDTIVHTTQAFGNQDVFLDNVAVDELTEKARAATGGLEGLFLYHPYTQEGSVQCDATAGVPAVNYGGNTYAWNWYDETVFGAIWDMVENQTIPSEQFICQYNTGEGNPNDPAISRLMIDTLVRYMVPRLVAAMQSQETTSSELKAEDISLRIFPNPSHGRISISAAEDFHRVAIMDINGKNVWSQNVQSQQHEVHVGNLSAGLYVLELAFDNGLIHKKISISR